MNRTAESQTRDPHLGGACGLHNRYKVEESKGESARLQSVVNPVKRLACTSLTLAVCYYGEADLVGWHRPRRNLLSKAVVPARTMELRTGVAYIPQNTEMPQPRL